MSEKIEPNIFSKPFQRAVSQLQFRAEMQADSIGRDLKDSYVDLGVLVQIENARDQVIFGRRGAGKTHLLLQLEDHSVRENSLLSYIDCRRLASGIFEPGLPVEKQADKFFRSLLAKVHSFILEELTRLEALSEANRGKAFDHLNRMVNAIGQNSFTEYCYALEDCLRAIGKKHLFLVIDEWVAIPQDVQPYVSSLVKKIFSPSEMVVLKIGAIAFQTQLGKPIQGGGMLGLEIGSDIFVGVDLDEYLVYDQDSAGVKVSFGKILYRHLATKVELPKEDPAAWIVSAFFTGQSAFDELIRACEGVPRDFLMIFCQAYFAALPTSEKISIPTIRKAAHAYFLREKYKNIEGDPALDRFLSAVIDKAIGGKRARAFMIENRLAAHPIIRRLFDHRLIHLLKRGYSDGKSPGVRYQMFSVDYGTYVDFINTAKEPQIEFLFMSDGQGADDDEAVPFNDMRKIRYIKLDEVFFNEFAPPQLPVTQ